MHNEAMGHTGCSRSEGVNGGCEGGECPAVSAAPGMREMEEAEGGEVGSCVCDNYVIHCYSMACYAPPCVQRDLPPYPCCSLYLCSCCCHVVVVGCIEHVQTVACDSGLAMAALSQSWGSPDAAHCDVENIGEYCEEFGPALHAYYYYLEEQWTEADYRSCSAWNPSELHWLQHVHY